MASDTQQQHKYIPMATAEQQQHKYIPMATAEQQQHKYIPIATITSAINDELHDILPEMVSTTISAILDLLPRMVHEGFPTVLEFCKNEMTDRSFILFYIYICIFLYFYSICKNEFKVSKFEI